VAARRRTQPGLLREAGHHINPGDGKAETAGTRPAEVETLRGMPCPERVREARMTCAASSTSRYRSPETSARGFGSPEAVTGFHSPYARLMIAPKSPAAGESGD
jgi:hypothetical protein